MNSINSRLRRLEERATDGPCPECAGSKEIVVTYDDAVREEYCPACGRALTIISVVYDGNEEGEGP